MKSIAILFTTIFLIISIVSILLGISIVAAKPKSRLGRVFFLITVCLSLWALGFSVAISAPTSQICLLWRRVSAVGWGSIFALILHFTLLLKGSKILSHKAVYFVMYAPAALMVTVFALSEPMAAAQYVLVRTGSGWVNAAVNNVWDIIFYIYIVIYLCLTFATVWSWRRKTADNNEKKQAGLLLASFGAAVVLGTLTDLLNSSLSLLNIPQMAPVAFLIPLLAISHSMKKYRFMQAENRNEAENILTDTSRGKILHFMAFVFMVGGALLFISQYIMEKDHGMWVLAGTCAMVFFGIVLLILKKIKMTEDATEKLFIITSVVSIPTLTLGFMHYASITIWAFPFVFVILSMLFNNKRLLAGAALTTLLTQVVLWILAPSVPVIVSGSSYIIRFGIFSIAFWIAFYVNKVYLKRLNENSEKNKYQRFVSEISSRFVAITEQNKDALFHTLLVEAGKCFIADNAYLTLRSNQDGTNEVYVLNNEVRQINRVAAIYNAADMLLRQSRVIHCVDDGPVDADLLGFLSSENVKSFISHTFQSTELYSGCIALERAEATGEWSHDQVESLKIVANIVSDSMARLSAEKEIEFMAYHDPLTRLPNRMLFRDRTEQAIRLARRQARQIGVVFLDLDSFKSVNDTMGHKVGDELIREVANKLDECVRDSDTVSRFGGDEFLIMLNNMTNRNDYKRVLGDIMALFNKPFNLHGQEVFITASAGVSIYPQDGEETDALIKNADIAMYSAKEKGKNQFLFCSSDMKDDVQRKVKLTNYLYRALERNELRVYYQPQVCLQTKKIIGAEALLRWFHPDLGSIPPGDFIPLAEKTGLIQTIGEWVLRQTCMQNKAWQDKGLPCIRTAVNISVNQLRNPNFIDQVQGVLAETGINPELLELEVTESVATREPAYILSLLGDLKKLGVLLSIDDFGTEYSSLSRLKQLPVDRIKMDMQFVHGIDKNDKDKAISKTIINLAKSLDIKVIAEGVESQEQLRFLNQKQCDEVQGYIYYKPMPAEELEQILYNNQGLL